MRVSRLPDAIAAAIEHPAGDARHRTKVLKMTGDFRLDPGNTFVRAEARDAANVLTPILVGGRQVDAARALREIGGLPALHDAYTVLDAGENYEERCVLADGGAPMLEVLTRLIAAGQHEETQGYVAQFPWLAVVSRAGSTWAELATIHLNEAPRPMARPVSNYDPEGRPLLVVFGRKPATKPKSARDLPHWGARAGLTHATSIDYLKLLRISDLLGPLDRRPAWPEIRTVRLNRDGAPTEANAPSVVNPPVAHPGATPGVSLPIAEDKATQRHGQQGSPPSGLSDRDEGETQWPATSMRRESA